MAGSRRPNRLAGCSPISGASPFHGSCWGPDPADRGAPGWRQPMGCHRRHLRRRDHDDTAGRDHAGHGSRTVGPRCPVVGREAFRRRPRPAAARHRAPGSPVLRCIGAMGRGGGAVLRSHWWHGPGGPGLAAAARAGAARTLVRDGGTSPVGAILHVRRVGDLGQVGSVGVRRVDVFLAVDVHAEHDLRPVG